MSTDPADPDDQSLAEQALAEPAAQDYVGSRDLTRWPSAIGRKLSGTAGRAARRIAPDRLFAIILVVGLSFVCVLTALAAGVYDAVAEKNGIAGLDQPVLDAAISIRTPTWNHLITLYTNLGSAAVMPILATLAAGAMALSWRQWTPIILTAVTGLGSVLLTMIGKAVVGRARPPLADAVAPFETSKSFPSGHSLNALAIAGIVVYLLIRRQRSTWARALTVTAGTVFAVSIGLSRVYLGHHWLTDVLVAWILALTWLTVVITAHRLFLTLRSRPPDPVPE